MAGKYLIGSGIILFSLISCSEKSTPSYETLQKEVMATEKDFEKMAGEKGVAEAFWYYADDSAVIKRGNDSLIHGKNSIRDFYSRDFYKSAKVNWTPDFIQVSEDGTLAWTYGKYTWKATNDKGEVQEAHGIFHTVWKKQKDGTWRYVWD
jgi:ketosteroid isomerase-like protein